MQPVDDLTFAARRATSRRSARAEPDLETRFKTLVQSPLRAGILRFLSARPDEAFDTEAIMQTFGRMRQDVDNCVNELVEFGVVRQVCRRPADATGGSRPSRSRSRSCSTSSSSAAPTSASRTSSPSVQRFREMIGRDEKMLAIFEWIRTAAKSDISVLILGPTGSGKELVARMIHELSRRGPENFQAVNCAALPDTLFESEIFGYEKGAFTGAHDRKPGRLELANGGTLFLDEVGDMSLMAQAKLLRVLEERRFERLGGNKLDSGRLPPDLGDQPAARHVRPREPLPRRSLLPHQRVRDSPAVAARSARSTSRCSPTASWRATAPPTACRSTPSSSRTRRRTCSATYHWPGNIRELESTVSRAALSAPGRVIRAADIEFLHGHASRAGRRAPRRACRRCATRRRAHIIRVLEAVDWNKLEAAKVLDISRGTLYRKIEEYGLEPAAAGSGAAAASVAMSRQCPLLYTSRFDDAVASCM